MDSPEMPLPTHHQQVIDRFVAACAADGRVVAAFLGGSYAAGTADPYSDLDLYVITSDEAFADVLAGRERLVRRLGEPRFLEDFGIPQALFYMLADQTEGELWIGRVGHFQHLHAGPYRILLDKEGILAGAVFPEKEANQAEQVETLRRQIAWFWHELSHFIKAMGRGQLWFAYGQLEVMRQMCVRLARLRYNFSDPYVGQEPYFKVEQALPVAQLSPLQSTFCAMVYGEMLQAAIVLVRFYQGLAPNLAAAHGLRYEQDLERIMVNQLEELRKAA